MSTAVDAGAPPKGDAGAPEVESLRKCTCKGVPKEVCKCPGAFVGKAGYKKVAAADAPRAAREGDGRTKGLFKDKCFRVNKLKLAGDVPACVVWRRPHELCENPQVYVDDASRLDVLQGQSLGDCWLIAACSALADHPDLVKELIPDGLELKPGGSENNYDGKVTIHLWASGSRFPMEIDDRLPVMKNNNGFKLIYGACKENSEFWLPLVEKAVAKYQGGYKKLRGRQIAEGLIILTGYSVNRVDLVNCNPIDDLYDFLNKELKRKSLIIAAGKTNEVVRISRKVLFNKRDCEESVKKSDYHSYTVNKVLKLSDGTQLIRIRNPWGTEADCTGKFRISDDLLKGLEPPIVDELLLCPCSDGEYWVDKKGFYDKFEEMCIANKYPSVSVDQLVPSTDVACARGVWKGKSIGGRPGSKNFENNCQFLFQVDIIDHEAVKEEVQVLLELIQDLHRKCSIPFESGMEISQLKPHVASWQAVGAANLRRYSPEQLEKGALVQTPSAEDGSAQACAVRHFYELTPGTPHVVVTWMEKKKMVPPVENMNEVPSEEENEVSSGEEEEEEPWVEEEKKKKKKELSVNFLLRIYSPAGVVVRLSPLPDPS